jgi:hypothetical protein
MPLLVSSASGVNGDGYGALLAFDLDGRRLGKFSDDARIEDPRGLAVDQKSGLLFLNSGSDRVLALNRQGEVVRETGRVAHLNPGGANFGPDGRYYLTLRGAGRSWRSPYARRTRRSEFCLSASCRFLAGLHSAATARRADLAARLLIGVRR